MRLALDAPELDYKWVLAQRADEEELRKEAEELAQEEAAQKVLPHTAEEEEKEPKTHMAWQGLVLTRLL